MVGEVLHATTTVGNDANFDDVLDDLQDNVIGPRSESKSESELLDSRRRNSEVCTD